VRLLLFSHLLPAASHSLQQRSFGSYMEADSFYGNLIIPVIPVVPASPKPSTEK
jgi:hypothetical protein